MEYEAPSNVHPSVPTPMLRRMVGACDLTREISRHPGNLPSRSAKYDSVLRSFVDEIQAEVNPRLLRLGMHRGGGRPCRSWAASIGVDLAGFWGGRRPAEAGSSKDWVCLQAINASRAPQDPEDSP
ncbi:hypothetical protein ACFQ10_51065 [Streptomyces indonesiensis]